jgi:hypothetical protein
VHSASGKSAVSAATAQPAGFHRKPAMQQHSAQAAAANSWSLQLVEQNWLTGECAHTGRQDFAQPDSIQGHALPCANC